MRNLLSDLCIEAESHTCMAMFMARAFDDLYSSSDGSSRSSGSGSTEEQQRKEELFRVGVSVSKYFVTKRLPGFIYECMEVLGTYYCICTTRLTCMIILPLDERERERERESQVNIANHIIHQSNDAAVDLLVIISIIIINHHHLYHKQSILSPSLS
jgi:hypothetical protein